MKIERYKEVKEYPVTNPKFAIHTTYSNNTITLNWKEEEFNTYEEAHAWAIEHLTKYQASYSIVQVYGQFESTIQIKNKDKLPTREYALLSAISRYSKGTRTPELRLTKIIKAIDIREAKKQTGGYGKVFPLKNGKVTEKTMKYWQECYTDIKWEQPTTEPEKQELLSILPTETAEKLKQEWVIEAL